LNKRIILFSIGSVQNFIINSRKTIDLYNSSKILSQLIFKGISFFEKYNGKLLLPELEFENKLRPENIPNYFLLTYKNDASVGSELEKYIKKCYLEMFLSCLKKNFSEDVLENYKEQFSEQLNSSLDIYWVDYKLENEFTVENSNEYKEIYDKMYKYLNGVKNVKKFSSTTEEGKKCSICGKRNAIFVSPKINIRYKPQFKYSFKKYKENGFFELLDKLKLNNIMTTNYDRQKIRENKKDNFLFENEKNFYLKDNEILCAPCYLKRLYKYKRNFNIPSIAKIAVFHWLESTKKDKKYQQYEKNFQKVFQKALQKTRVLDKYESRYPEVWQSKAFCDVDDIDIRELKKSFNNLKNKNITKYYCIYRMDIDDLGKWMSGKYKGDNKKSLYEYQFELSKQINNFFNYVRMESNKMKDGLLVYAGGDDLMVLIPVYKIYDFIKMISEGFSKEVKKDSYKNITYSQGIFITHYRAPLGEVIRISKEELENVKKRYKKALSCFDIPKNASVISIINEGYNERSVYCKNNTKYKIIDRDVKTNEFLFCNLTEYFLHELSYYHDELESEFIGFDKDIKHQYECNKLMSMISVEQKRLIKRSVLKNNDVNSENITEADIDILNENLINFLNINCVRENDIDLQNYFNLFHVIRKFNSIMKEGLECENNGDKA
jgi:CRISPR-associated protein Cmr2